MWSFLSLIFPGLAKGLLGYLQSRNDTELAKLGLSRDVAVSVVSSESKRQEAALDVYKLMLSHPVFWIAWGLGVFPVMLYHSSIFWVSIFPFWGWEVLKAPPDQLEFAKTVVGNVFLLTGTSTVVAGLAQAWTKRT
jgi:hypothetical protein